MSTPSVVYATDTAAVALTTGEIVNIYRGQRYGTDLRVVREQPGWFSTDPQTGIEDGPVETATANPGERRNARRG